MSDQDMMEIDSRMEARGEADVDIANENENENENENDFEVIDETYTVLDLGKEAMNIDAGSSYQLVGMDIMRPYLRYGGRFFVGKMDTIVGSEMIFHQDSNGRPQYFVSTRKRITFCPAQLKPKDPISLALALKPLKKPEPVPEVEEESVEPTRDIDTKVME